MKVRRYDHTTETDWYFGESSTISILEENARSGDLVHYEDFGHVLGLLDKLHLALRLTPNDYRAVPVTGQSIFDEVTSYLQEQGLRPKEEDSPPAKPPRGRSSRAVTKGKSPRTSRTRKSGTSTKARK